MTEKEFHYRVQQIIDKTKTPSLYLEDHNMYANMAVGNWVKRNYPKYDTSQQSTDDLQVLKGIARYEITTATSASIVASLKLHNTTSGVTATGQRTFDGISFQLPDDYYHLLKARIGYKPRADYKCYNKDRITWRDCKRLVDANAIEDNTYLTPSYQSNYIYIYNNNTFDKGVNPTDQFYDRDRQASFEIRNGNVEDKFDIAVIDIRYLKYPRRLNLTEQQLAGAGDDSAVIEFPDYICDEILKEMSTLILERNSDQRLGTFPQTNNTNIQ